jgi:hypothetical protein
LGYLHHVILLHGMGVILHTKTHWVTWHMQYKDHKGSEENKEVLAFRIFVMQGKAFTQSGSPICGPYKNLIGTTLKLLNHLGQNASP